MPNNLTFLGQKLTFSSAVTYILPTSSAAAEQTSDRKPVTDLGEKKPLPYPGSLVSCNVTHPCISIEEQSMFEGIIHKNKNTRKGKCTTKTVELFLDDCLIICCKFII